MKSSLPVRGVADPLTLALVGLLALGAGVFGSSWKPFDFSKKPPTEELTKLQAQLAEAQKAAEQARKEQSAAESAERAKLESQIRSAQQDNLGTQSAIARIPVEHKTAEVKLAASMANRVSLKLAAAIGELPKDQQQAMLSLIDQALSDKQAEVDEALRKLAQRDAEFAALTHERDQIKAQIPILEQKAVKAEELAKNRQSEVTAKTDEVKAVADKLDAEKRQSGSFKAAAERAFNWILGIIGIWAFLAYVLPGLTKHLDSANPIKGFLRNLSGYTCAPLLYHDAKAKLNALAQQIESKT